MSEENVVSPSKKEGRKVTFVNPMDRVGNYIMPDRIGSSNYFRFRFDVSRAEEYVAAKKLAGLNGFSLLHVVLAAYTRTLCRFPGINRFIRGQKVFSRNDIEYSMVVKKEMRLDSPETCIKLIPSPDATAEDIYRDLSGLVSDNKGLDEANNMDAAAGVLSHIPGLFLKFAVGLLKSMDYFGLLPRYLTIVSPFHASMFITSMQSLGIPPIYHHLYDFGNCPIFLSVGLPFSEYKLREDGSVDEIRCMEINFAMDERICDGHYYASALRYFKRIIEHPECLDVPPESVTKDPRIKLTRREKAAAKAADTASAPEIASE